MRAFAVVALVAACSSSQATPDAAPFGSIAACATCDPKTEYCGVISSGVARFADGCQPIPAACAGSASCACIQPTVDTTGCAAPSCNGDARDGIVVVCGNP